MPDKESDENKITKVFFECTRWDKARYVYLMLQEKKENPDAPKNLSEWIKSKLPTEEDNPRKK